MLLQIKLLGFNTNTKYDTRLDRNQINSKKTKRQFKGNQKLKEIKRKLKEKLKEK